MPKDKILRIFFLAAVSLFLLGLIARIFSLGNLGFEFDTITTQHEWAKNAIEMGFLNFWATYNKYLDYLPGAVFFDALIKGLALIINSAPETFVLVLKIFNLLVDLTFICLLGLFVRDYLHIKLPKVLAIIGLLWALPALWIVSTFWGQFDNLIVLLLFVSFVNLATEFRFPWQRAGKLKKIRNIVWAGFFLAVAFSLKPQPLLFFPVYILYLFARRQKALFTGFLKGFIPTFLLINIVPFLCNPSRTITVFTEVFSRGDVISKGAGTFWTLYANLQNPGNILFSLGPVHITLSIAAITLFSLIMVIAVLYLIKFQLHKKIHINFPQIMLLVCLENLAYFLFMLGVHSRYAQFIAAYAVIPLFYLKKRWHKLVYLAIYLLFNLAYAFNQLSVYYYNYKDKFPLNLDNIIYNPLSSQIVTGIYLIMLIMLLYCLKFFRSNAEGES